MKTCLLVSLCCFFTFVSSAQFSLGFVAGVNINSVKSNNELAKPSSANDFFFGVVPAYSFNEKYKVHAEVKYLRKGYETALYSFSSPGSIRMTYRNSYLELAPQFEYDFSRNIGVSLGIYCAIKTNESQKMNDQRWMSTNNFDFFKGTDLGLVVGFRTYFNQFTAFAMYEHGFVDVSNIILVDINGNPIGEDDLRNQTIQIGLGYFWSKG